MMTLAELRALPHTSVSALRTFLLCPRKYRLQYLDRVEPAFQPISLAFGSAWHDVLDSFFADLADGKMPSKGELHERLRETLAVTVNQDGPPVLFDEEAQTLEATAKLASRMLDAFLGNFSAPDEVLYVELPFLLELRDQTTGELLPVPLIGAMDVVTREHGEQTVVELKTAKRGWSTDQLACDLQLTAYYGAARSLGMSEVALKLIVVTKTWAPSVQIERPCRGQQHQADLVATVASVLRAVNAGVDHPVRGWACRGCPLAHACR